MSYLETELFVVIFELFFSYLFQNVQSSRSASATKGFSRNRVIYHGNQWRVRDCHFRFTSATFYVFGA